MMEPETSDKAVPESELQRDFERVLAQTGTLPSTPGSPGPEARRLADLDRELGEVVDVRNSTPRRPRAMPSSALQPGDRVGRFVLSQLLGEGGMGSCFQARDTLLGREVALKVCRHTGAGRDQAAVSDREARLMATLRHSHIARLFETGLVDVDGRPMRWLAMDLVEQARPITVWAATLKPSLKDLVSVFRGAVDAVEYAHSRGILHNDLKPSNLLVDSNDRAWVIDFGIARVMDASIGGRTLTDIAGIGTMAYMAPETAELGGAPDVRADVFSLGAILHEVIAGVPLRPCDTASMGERIRLLQYPPVVPLRSVRPDCPAALERIVSTALATDPALRYATAAALAEDLRRFEAGEPVRLHMAPPTERFRAFVRAHRQLAAATVAAAVLLGSVTAVSLWWAGVARAQARTSSIQAAALALSTGDRVEFERHMTTLREVDPEDDSLERAILERGAALGGRVIAPGNWYAVEVDEVSGTAVAVGYAPGTETMNATGLTLAPGSGGACSVVDEFALTIPASLESIAAQAPESGTSGPSATAWAALAGGAPFALQPTESMSQSPDLGLAICAVGDDMLVVGSNPLSSYRVVPADGSSGPPAAKPVMAPTAGRIAGPIAEPIAEGAPLACDDIRSIAWSPAAWDLLAVATDAGAFLVEADTLEPCCTLGPTDMAHWTITATDDGRFLASGADHAIRCWREDGTALWETAPLSDIAWSLAPLDQEVLAVLADGSIAVLDLTTGEVLGIAPIVAERAWDVEVAPWGDGSRLLLGTQDGLREIELDAVLGFAGYSAHGGSEEESLTALSETGAEFVAGPDESVRCWTDSTDRLHGAPHWTWDASGGDTHVGTTPSQATDLWVGRLGPSQRETVLVTGKRFGCAALDAATGMPLWVTRRLNEAYCVCAAADGESVLVGLRDGWIIRLESRSGDELQRRRVALPHPTAIATSPDGARAVARVVVGFQDGSVRLLDADSLDHVMTMGVSGRRIERIEFGTGLGANALAFTDCAGVRRGR